MNILFVSSEFPLSDNQATGGIGTYLLNLSNGLINQGHKVTVITKGYGINKHKNVNVILCNFGVAFLERVKRIFSLPLLNHLVNFVQYPVLFSLESYIKINQLSKKQKIDIIEGNDFGGELFFNLLFRNNKLPVVLRLHTPSFIIQRFNNEPVNLFYSKSAKTSSACLPARQVSSRMKTLSITARRDVLDGTSQSAHKAEQKTPTVRSRVFYKK